MRIATCRYGDNESIAVIRNGAAILLPQEYGDMVDIIESGRSALDDIGCYVESHGLTEIAVGDISLLPPVRRFSRDILCTGWNYLDHFHESLGRREGQDVPLPEAPTFFTKSPHTAIGPYDDIAYDPRISSQWDYEAEVAVVFGKQGRSIPTEEAMDYIWGYCLANDISQRNLQRRHGAQWYKGKSIDQTMPIGPWLVTADEVVPTDIHLRCFLNGEKMQDASTEQMAFSIPTLIAELSYGMTISAGDILLTGTPSGIGNARTPPVFLQANDEVLVTGSGLGELRNRLVKTDLLKHSDVDLN